MTSPACSVSLFQRRSGGRIGDRSESYTSKDLTKSKNLPSLRIPIFERRPLARAWIASSLRTLFFMSKLRSVSLRERASASVWTSRCCSPSELNSRARLSRAESKLVSDILRTCPSRADFDLTFQDSC